MGRHGPGDRAADRRASSAARRVADRPDRGHALRPRLVLVRIGPGRGRPRKDRAGGDPARRARPDPVHRRRRGGGALRRLCAGRRASPRASLLSIDDGAELRIGPDGACRERLEEHQPQDHQERADPRDGHRPRVPGGQEPAKLAVVFGGGGSFARRWLPAAARIAFRRTATIGVIANAMPSSRTREIQIQSWPHQPPMIPAAMPARMPTPPVRSPPARWRRGTGPAALGADRGSARSGWSTRRPSTRRAR